MWTELYWGQLYKSGTLCIWQPLNDHAYFGLYDQAIFFPFVHHSRIPRTITFLISRNLAVSGLIFAGWIVFFKLVLFTVCGQALSCWRMPVGSPVMGGNTCGRRTSCTYCWVFSVPPITARSDRLLYVIRCWWVKLFRCHSHYGTWHIRGEIVGIKVISSHGRYCRSVAGVV